MGRCQAVWIREGSIECGHSLHNKATLEVGKEERLQENNRHERGVLANWQLWCGTIYGVRRMRSERPSKEYTTSSMSRTVVFGYR